MYAKDSDDKPAPETVNCPHALGNSQVVPVDYVASESRFVSGSFSEPLADERLGKFELL